MMDSKKENINELRLRLEGVIERSKAQKKILEKILLEINHKNGEIPADENEQRINNKSN